jgi:hypothetical protein
MSDPLNPWEEKDRLQPSGDLSPLPEGQGRAPGDEDENPATELNRDASASGETAATDGASTGGASTGDEANDLEADNAVEADTIETLDPENPPA